jgi:hypothetical protein
MAIYKRKPSEPIDAEQFTDQWNPPRGVTECKASAGETYFTVTTMQGQNVRVHPGEWIVAERCGGERYYPIAPDEFERLYELAAM